MKVAVLCGGFSPERDVSLSSGRRICAALRALGHRVALVDMYLGLDGPPEAAYGLPLPGGGCIPAAGPDLEALRASRGGRSKGLFGEGVLELCSGADIVFNALHGGCGEDGRVQAAFELLGIRFTGSGSAACALAMDKNLAKLAARSLGVRTADWLCFPGPWPAGAADAVRLPCVVKPAASGSSLGVSVVREREDLAPALEAAARGGRALAEDYIAGREIQCSVLGGKALPSIEIAPRSGFYDYESKYVPGAAAELSPAPIPAEAERELASVSEALYAAFNLKGLARADFIMDGTGRFWFLEFNALPGMTPTSLAPQEAAAAGISYEELCQRIIDLAFEEENI